jgi:hypothetical protein
MFLDFRVSRFLGFKVMRCLEIKVSDFQGIWVFSF